jgi:glutamine cyclotransferase
MTRTSKEIITSDGTSTLRFRNPETFAVTRSLNVTDAGQPVSQLNELEYIKGQIYANVWHTNRIARISPTDGHVVDWFDLTGLLSPMLQGGPEAVLNGIAYDPQHDRLFVTGKQWPLIFEIQIVPKRK